MVQKIVVIFLIIIFIICCFSGISAIAKEENQTKDSSIRIENEYIETDNLVIVRIISEIELENTKPTWNLSEDRKEYTKKFTSNIDYYTPIKDINGSIIDVNIKVTEIQPLKIELQYNYDSFANSVEAVAISNTEFKNTKPTWNLNDNKKEYRKIFSGNIDYSTPFEDINGNIIDINIKVTEIQPLKIELQYNYNSFTNSVEVVAISNTELKNTKPTWNLNDNKKEYRKIFNDNIDYTTPFEDINENIINLNVKITDVKKMRLDVIYDYDETKNEEIVKVISNIPFNDTKPTWTLSSDKLIYTKSFDDNINYSTLFMDCYGNIISVDLDIEKIDKNAPIIKLNYKYNENGSVTISAISNEKLGNTKPTWDLSEDQMIYSKTFNNDEDYYTSFQDTYGNSVLVYIKLKKKMNTYVGIDNSKIYVGYMYTSDEYVIIQVTSDIQFKDTKPTWNLSEDKYTYTKIFSENQDYSTPFVNANDVTTNIPIYIDWFFKIIIENGQYGKSGALVNGIAGGSNLEYLRFGNGPNVFFATFCVHGFEDNWDRDGQVLVNIANEFYNKLINDNDKELAKKWTIYVIREVNPDGLKLGYTKNGPGRTTLYSTVGKGIDINRSWQTGNYFKRYTDNRNYNGTEGFQAYEAAALRDFLLAHRSKNGKTILIDLHGWEDQLIGDPEISEYYKQQYTSCSTRNYGNYGTQYLISWARQNLGARSVLVELPSANNFEQVNNMGLSYKYIVSTLNMLKGM